MLDLNDLYYFHAVVTHGGFTAASDKIGVAKGTLSKRIARLEEQLRVRLLERSTRRTRTTDVGQAFYEQCQAMLAGAEGAEAVVAQAQDGPQGIVRISCPPGLIQDLMADVLLQFIQLFPQVQLQLRTFNRPADLVEDRIDVALRARARLDTNPSLIVRSLAPTELVLAMSPALRKAVGGEPAVEALGQLPTLSMMEEVGEDVWELTGPGDEKRRVVHRPRLFCGDLEMLRAAAIQGLGVALLPEHVCRPRFASGELVRVLPLWRAPAGIIHAVFTTRKGLLPGVRALIDHLVREVPKKVGHLPGA